MVSDGSLSRLCMSIGLDGVALWRQVPSHANVNYIKSAHSPRISLSFYTARRGGIEVICCGTWHFVCTRSGWEARSWCVVGKCRPARCFSSVKCVILCSPSRLFLRDNVSAHRTLTPKCRCFQSINQKFFFKRVFSHKTKKERLWKYTVESVSQ